MKTIKRFFLFCSAVAILAAQNSSLTLVPPTTSANPSVVQVSLQNTTAPAPSIIEFTVGTTKDFTGITAAIGAAGTAANKQISCGQFVNNSFTCLVWGLNATPLGNGVIATLSLIQAPSLALTTEPVTLQPTLMSDVNGNLLASTGTGASVPVSSACDLNGDGVIDSKDVLLDISQALVGGTACTTGDINKDGKCDLLDVARIVIAALPTGTSGVTNPGVCKVGP